LLVTLFTVHSTLPFSVTVKETRSSSSSSSSSSERNRAVPVTTGTIPAGRGRLVDGRRGEALAGHHDSIAADVEPAEAICVFQA